MSLKMKTKKSSVKQLTAKITTTGCFERLFNLCPMNEKPLNKKNIFTSSMIKI